MFVKHVIFHIDMNSYFASCEQQANPHLRGRPVGVCEHLGGIIIAPSVEAKRLGIKTGTPVWEARKIDPGVVLLPVDPPKYREITRRFLKIFSEYSDLIERYSIDEAFLDITHLVKKESNPWSAALMIALEIKWRIRQEVGEWLTCSVGAGSNKLVAKIASDLDKPDGVVVISEEKLPALYDRLNLTDIPGIAERTKRRLNNLGIFSLRDLALYPESKLRAQFGMVGHYLHNLGNLRANVDLTTLAQETIKSMGHAYTLPRATDDARLIKKLLFKLAEKVAVRLRQKNFWGSVVACYVRVSDRSGGHRYAGFGRSKKIHELTQDGKVIFAECWKMFQSWRVLAPVRMAGVAVSGLVANFNDEPLFERYRKPRRVLNALDRVNGKYGEFFLRRAVLCDARFLAPDTVGFGRMKETEKM